MFDKLSMGCRSPGDQDMMHLSVPEHHMASMAATLQPDMHHQKQDQVCLPAIRTSANLCGYSARLKLLKTLDVGTFPACALCVGMGSSIDGAPACHVMRETQLLSHARWLCRCESVVSIETVPVIAQALTAEQILAQYGTLPDQHHDVSAQHVLASQHMHMQQGNNTGQQA